MYFLDPKTGLLTISKNYTLENTPKPNLLREVFPYTEVPRTLFDHYHVPMNCPKDIFITDTTFRDGQQARPPYTVEQTIALFDMHHRLGGPNGVIKASEFFLYSNAIAHKDLFISDFYTSRITGALCLTVSAPVYIPMVSSY